MAIYIGGAVIGVMPLVARFEYLQWRLADKPGKVAELSREMWLWLKASAACFVAAGMLVILGIERTF